jgi:integrase
MRVIVDVGGRAEGLVNESLDRHTPTVPEALTFHALRHVAVTAMADAGVHYNVTQRRAEHSTARMTMERYSHRSTDPDVRAPVRGTAPIPRLCPLPSSSSCKPSPGRSPLGR